MRVTLIPINGSAGAWVTVNATQLDYWASLVEDASIATAQGLQYRLRNDGTPAGFTTVFELQPGLEPLILGNPIAQGSGRAPILGNAADSSGGHAIPATPLIQLRSLGTATTVRLTEYP